jgi:hypothetical protein
MFGPGIYFQTGQVIFVPEWPKGEFVSILALFCVWTKLLICKDTANRDSTVQSEVRRNSKFPVSRPDDVSSRPDTYCSCPIRPDTYTVSRNFCVSLLLSGRFSSTFGRYSVLERFSDSSQVPRKGRSINRPDDVVYSSDAYLHKARIAVQI